MRATEAILIVKTRPEFLPALEEELSAMHSYDCACIVALPIVGGNPAYLDWIRAETAGRLEK